MKINILLPYKEKFDEEKLSSVSITVINNFNHSQFKKNIRIFGREIKNPAKPESYFAIKNSLNFFRSKNINLARKMCNIIKKESDAKQIIEIHNRPLLFHYVTKKLKNKFPINIFFHNDPLNMSGSKTLDERRLIVRNSKAILCVSKYIRTKFLTGFKEIPQNVFVLHNGVDRKLINFPEKHKEMIFVGRLVKEKGVELFINAVEKISEKLPEWKFSIVGASHLGEMREKSSFANLCSKKFLNIKGNTAFTGYLSNSAVQKKMQNASIVIVPSLWDEPYGLVVAEAMSNGAAVITSYSGGIPEVIGSNGIVIKDINQKKLESAMYKLASSTEKLHKLQMLSWNNFTHTALRSSKRLDQIRTKIFKDCIF